MVFSKRLISDLANHLPRKRSLLRSLLPRFFDLLPVLVPELTYATVEVQSGDVARVAWLEMLNTKNDSKRLSLTNSLKAYCALDTLALVRIYQALVEQLRAIGFVFLKKIRPVVTEQK